jgi:hypothetical protein
MAVVAGRSTRSLGSDSIVVNLNVIEPGKYFAHGTHGLSEGHVRVQIQIQAEVEAFPNALTIDGEARHGPNARLGFHCELKRDDLSQTQTEAAVSVTGLFKVSGRAAILGSTVEVLASDPSTGSVLSARFVPSEESLEYELSGVLCLNGVRWFPFYFRAGPTESREALANVVGIHTKKAV